MESLHDAPFPPEGEEAYIPPPLIIDGISITDAKGWSYLRNSPHMSDEVATALQLAQKMESGIAGQDTLTDAWEKHNESIRSEVDPRTLFRAVLILKKHWLYGEELYELYTTTY